MNITIRQLKLEDWQDFKLIRLHALKESPQSFGAKYEKAITKSKENWEDPLKHSDRALFGLFDDKKIIGLGFIRVSEENTNEAGLYMAYIRPEYRGKGLSKKLYEARIEWALKRKDIDTIFTYNYIDNKAAQAMNKAFGFELDQNQSLNDKYKYKLIIG